MERDRKEDMMLRREKYRMKEGVTVREGVLDGERYCENEKKQTNAVK